MESDSEALATPATNGLPIRFSVIIPTYNRSDLLLRAIESVERQDVAGTEIIIVDDGSTDEASLGVMEQLSGRPGVQCVLQRNCGAAAARNRGAARAAAEFILFLDSDDELLPGCLRRLGEALIETGAAFVSGAASLVDANGRETRIRAPENLGPAFADQVGLFLAGTFAIDRVLFHQVGGFAEACRSSQHTELALRLTPYCRHTARTLTAIPEPCVRIHAHEAAHLRGDLQTLLDGALYVIHVHDRQLRRCRRYHADWCTIAAVYAAKLGEYATSRWLLRRALQSHRGRPSNYVRLALACVPPVARHIWRAES